MVRRLGLAAADHFVENWAAMVTVLERGDLLPARYKARRP